MRRNHTKYWLRRLKPDEKEQLNKEIKEHYELLLRIHKRQPLRMNSITQIERSVAYYTYIRAKDLVKNRRQYRRLKANQSGTQSQPKSIASKLFHDTIWED